MAWTLIALSFVAWCVCAVCAWWEIRRAPVLPVEPRQPKRVKVLAVPRGAEVYVVVYRPDQVDQAANVLARWAADSELSFDWGDACWAGRMLNEERAEAKGRRCRV